MWNIIYMISSYPTNQQVMRVMVQYPTSLLRNVLLPLGMQTITKPTQRRILLDSISVEIGEMKV